MKNKLDVNVKWEIDNDAQLDWLGVYTSNRPDVVYIDRKNDLLVDPGNLVFRTFDTENECLDFESELDNLDIWYNEGYEESPEGGTIQWNISYPYYEELPYDCRYDNNSYRYVESFNYPHAEKDEYQYVISDNKMLEDYNKGFWWMRGCIVTVSSNGVELGNASLWGLDSTMDDSEDQGIIDDLTDEAKEEAKKTLAILQNVELE
jgi:hypothetical protein